MEEKKEEMITVKMLSTLLGIKPIQIRRTLRKPQIKPKLVDVPNGWPQQKRRQYIWHPNDPELRKIMKAFSEKG